MWGELDYIHYYPRCWQTGYYRSGHDLINYITIWQYWLWFTFIFLINVYFVFIFRSISIRRADVRGRRAVGDKRRGAWPELLTCIFPLAWCLNILNNSLFILNTIETNGCYAVLTMQVAGFQWGWRYSYGELNYTRLSLLPIKVGYDAKIRAGKAMNTNTHGPYDVREARICRGWFKGTGNLQTVDDELIKSPIYRHGLTVVAQGGSPTELTSRRFITDVAGLAADPLRLFRTTGVIALPTRTLIRILSTAEDVTHSWALPALGIKLDCVPGRLFASFLNINREGVYYGQCSELCGWNHYNMPIIVYALPFEQFIVWWELELHATFLKQYDEERLNYKLLNVKYK